MLSYALIFKRVKRQGFWKVFLSPCSNLHSRILSIFNAPLLEGPKITAFQYRFSALPLCHRFSLTLLMILCIIDDELLKFLAILHRVPSFLNRYTICTLVFCRLVKPFQSACETPPYDLWSTNLICFQLFHWVFFFSFF